MATPHEDIRLTRGVADLVADARAQVTNLSVDELAAELGGGAVLVDIREPEEVVAHGSIPGAVLMPRGMLEFRADPGSPYHLDPLAPGRRVILHCATGGRSALAAATLQAMGYRDVAHLDGGLAAWKDAGKPVV